MASASTTTGSSCSPSAAFERRQIVPVPEALLRPVVGREPAGAVFAAVARDAGDPNRALDLPGAARRRMRLVRGHPAAIDQDGDAIRPDQRREHVMADPAVDRGHPEQLLEVVAELALHLHRPKIPRPPVIGGGGQRCGRRRKLRFARSRSDRASMPAARPARCRARPARRKRGVSPRSARGPARSGGVQLSQRHPAARAAAMAPGKTFSRQTLRRL